MSKVCGICKYRKPDAAFPPGDRIKPTCLACQPTCNIAPTYEGAAACLAYVLCQMEPRYAREG